MFGYIVKELSEHSPFTLFGALTGILLMMIFKNMPHEIAHGIFYVFHPAHVFLSAMVTTALYCQYRPDSRSLKKVWKVILIGFVGSVGVGTLSDSLIPLWGEQLLDMGNPEPHIGFIEKWWIVNPIAVAGIFVAYNFPFTKYPHALHVLVSTWASLFHMMMAQNPGDAIPYFGVFIFLFLGVWFPCCCSDIIFPLLFVRKPEDILKKECSFCGH
ncbi:MAG: hypothetical protein AB1650_00385 [Candidatus Omnitrophota bacterium]